jgi:hypothetical protein
LFMCALMEAGFSVGDKSCSQSISGTYWVNKDVNEMEKCLWYRNLVVALFF